MSLNRLLTQLDKTAARLEVDTAKRDALIHQLLEIEHVPVRTIAEHARVSHQTVININNRYKETHP